MKQPHTRTLSHVRSQLRTRGEWPGAVRLRRGWASAHARPWNDQTDRVASLRLERGTDRFLEACVTWLSEQGVERTLTPALPPDQTRIWRRAGFQDHLRLLVFERDLSRPPDHIAHEVVVSPEPDMSRLAHIDDRAFPPTWRVGRGGLSDARTATPIADVLTVASDGEVVAFAIVGEMANVAYLQRLAVDPDYTRRGIGRSLVRACMDWARKRGARAMILNTQPENLPAAQLYTSEGFVSLGPKLRVLACDTSPIR